MQKVIRAICLLVCGIALAKAEVIELEGKIKSIDQDARTISIERTTPKGTKTLDLEVNKNAGDLSTLKVGDKISFSFDPRLEMVTELQTGNQAAELFVAGSEWATDDGGLKIRVVHVDEGSFVGLMYGNGPNMLRELHGEINGNKVFWLAKNVVALKGQPGADNFGTVRQDKDGVHIDFRYGQGIENANQTFSVRRVSQQSTHQRQ